jgi:hypothetical protein
MKTYKVQHNQMVMVVEANSKMEAIEQVVNQVTVLGIKPEQVDGKYIVQSIARSKGNAFIVRRRSFANTIKSWYEVWDATEVEAPAKVEVEAPAVKIISTFTMYVKTVNGKRSAQLHRETI